MRSTAVTGIVLCGGSSKRIGTPKASIRLGDRSLVDIAVDKLALVCDEVLLCGDAGGDMPKGCRWVEDHPAADGPIAGILGGLQRACGEVCLVLACDMPLVPAELLAYLARRVEGYLAAVPYAGGRRHSLCAAYSKAVAGPMRDWVERRDYSPCRLLISLADKVALVSEEELRRFGDPQVLLLNVNTPADLEAARAAIESGRPRHTGL